MLAKIAARIEIQNLTQAEGFPSAECLQANITQEELQDHSVYEQALDESQKSLAGTCIPVRKNPRYALLPASRFASREWVRLRLRIKPDDEIWTFSVCNANGRYTRAGVALIRKGRAIDRVCTVIG